MLLEKISSINGSRSEIETDDKKEIEFYTRNGWKKAKAKTAPKKKAVKVAEKEEIVNKNDLDLDL